MSFPKSTKTFYKRSSLAKQRGAELMAKALGRAGQPSDNTKPPVTPDFVARKIKESTQHDCE